MQIYFFKVGSEIVSFSIDSLPSVRSTFTTHTQTRRTDATGKKAMKVQKGTEEERDSVRTATQK